MENFIHPIDEFHILPDYSVNLVLLRDGNNRHLHTGFVFKLGNVVKFFHFADHNDLRLEMIKKGKKYSRRFIFLDFVFFKINDESYLRRKSLIAYFESVLEENEDSIPYAFLYESTSFREDGKLDVSEGEYGLTCATFILAVLRNQGVNLLHLDTWRHRPEDKTFYSLVISSLSSRIYAEHLKHLKDNHDCARFRAEEVAGASTSYPIPINFKDAEAKGNDLQVLLN